MIQDPLSNSVALVQPLERADTLQIVCKFGIEHAHSNNLELPLSPSAEIYPVRVHARGALRPRALPAPVPRRPRRPGSRRGRASSSAPTGRPATRDLLVAMNQRIRDELRYCERDEEGTQTPQQTLDLGSGSCRDFALLMMEAARRLGFATRFVSGYLYDPALDGGAGDGTQGAGYTHAWLQAYLPGAGWVPFDPTNNLLGGTQLIRVGVARDPSQAAPISGSWFGETGDYLGMTVKVTVQRR